MVSFFILKAVREIAEDENELILEPAPGVVYRVGNATRAGPRRVGFKFLFFSHFYFGSNNNKNECRKTLFLQKL